MQDTILTVGNFDGVHRAHQQLLAQAGLLAADSQAPVVVLTFEPHPLQIVAPERAPQRLTPLDERLRLLQQAGADQVVVVHSTRELLKLEAEEFVQQVIIERFHPIHMVEGPTFGFGRGRLGTPLLLRNLLKPTGCRVHILDPIKLEIEGGDPLMVSSSLIRNLLTEGKVRKASYCLGRPYALFGEVVTGDQRGRTIGFPTANLKVDDQLIPAQGVYAGRAIWEDQEILAAISIGCSPTFGQTERRVEAHLLDFQGDLYGQTLRLEFYRRLREQVKFESADKLSKQLHLDVQQVRELTG